MIRIIFAALILLASIPDTQARGVRHSGHASYGHFRASSAHVHRHR